MVVALIATWVLATGPAPKAPALATAGSSKKWLGRMAAGLVLVAALLGLAARLYGLDGSLWLDEFGTLWAVEGDLHQLIDRTLSFHGQAPFYYAVVWGFVQLFGEHETVLRLPSVLASLGALGLVIWVGQLVGGRAAAFASGILFWLSHVSIHYSADARPYALGMFFTSLALLGFTKTVMQGGYRWRLTFILGAVGLILTHYVLALPLIGLAIGFLLWPALRVHYPWSHFMTDVALQAVLLSPFAFHLATVWSRRDTLQMVPDINLLVPWKLAMFFIGFIFAGLVAKGFPRLDSSRHVLFYLCGLCSIVPISILLVLAYYGVNLVTADRYISNTVVPLSLMGGLAISRAHWQITVPAWLMWVGLNGLIVCWSFLLLGSFSGAGREDWRQAVNVISHRSQQTKDPLILLRTFVEGDLLTEGHRVPPVLTAPLRSPGGEMPSWSIVPLTYNWDLRGREEYFEKTVVPAVASRDSFYYLGCQCGLNESSLLYEHRFFAWLDRRLDKRFTPTVLDGGAGMVLVHFSIEPGRASDSRD